MKEEIKVTKSQLNKMKHALGLNRNIKPNRNYYYTYANDDDWEELIAEGLADIETVDFEKGMAYFRVTKEGKEFLGVNE